MSKLVNLFKIDDYSSTISREIQAGLVLFMTVSYVFAVHPSIMAASGIPMGATVVITALIGGLATLFMALYANKPFVLLPGMGLNAFFAFTLVVGYGIPWQHVLGMVFISGIIFIIMTFLKIRELIANVLPMSLKNAITVSIGLFLTGLGLSNVGLINFSAGLLSVGNIQTPQVAVAGITLLVIAILMTFKVKAAFFIGIIVGTIIGIPFGITQIPQSLISLPPSISDVAFKADILGALKLEYLPHIFIFFFSNFVVTMSLLLGLGVKAGYLDENGNFPDINKPFLVDACATAGGALLGTSTVVTYAESAAGVEAGGRTGLASLVTAILFFLMIFFVPVAMMIPSAATAPVLIMIGLLMLEPIKNVNFSNIIEGLPAFIIIIFSTFTFDIAMGVSLGIISYIVLSIITGKAKETHWSLYIVGLLMLYYLMVK